MPSSAQSDDDIDRILYSVDLDSMVIVATRSGFDVKDFIRLVQTDTSFYRGFKNLRTTSYTFDNDIRIFDRKGKTKASYRSQATQASDGQCRTMSATDVVTTGRYYKRNNQKLNYYTSKFYERLFFTKGKVCDQTGTETSSPRGIERQVAELK